jgi:DivIVA domain-containing protein
MSQELAQETQLRQTRFRTGYAADEVERFVAAVDAALRSPTPGLHAADIGDKRFSPVVLQHGYRMDDVDNYLDGVEHLLREREQTL